jgi:hypothetical protein
MRGSCTCESLTSTKALANQSSRAQKLRHIRSCWSASPVRIVTSRATMASSHRAFAVTAKRYGVNLTFQL